MPQVHSRSVNDTSFGSDSRYMSSVRFSDRTLRRVNVLNALENRIATKKINVFQNDSAYKLRKLDRVRGRLEDNMNKRMAYKLVLKTNSFSVEKDQQKALNKRYSFQAFHNEVKEMMKFMKPDLVRERRSKILLQENKLKYDILLTQSRQRFNKLVPEKKTWISRQRQAQLDEERKERERLERERQEAEAKKQQEDKSKKGLATLRRRIITIDQTPTPAKSPALKTPILKTPASRTPVAKTPVRTPSPVKTPSIGKPPKNDNAVKRQGITMTMMKKQKSFVEMKERTMTPTGDKAEKVLEDRVKDLINNNVVNSAIVKESSDNVQSKNGQTQGQAHSLKGRKKIKKQPVLPPIDSHRTPREEGVSSAASGVKENSKPVKLPALKMTQNNQ